MKREKQNEGGVFPSVLSAALLQTAAQTPWPSVLAAGAAGTLLRRLPKGRTRSPGWLRFAQALWSILVMAQVLSWTGDCWEAPAAGLWAPPLLLALALWMSWKGAAAGNYAANILGLLQLGAILPILVAAVGDVRVENLLPVWQWPSGWLLAMLLLPGEKKGSGSGWLWAIAYSVITVGVRNGRAGFYEMSKSIALFGTVKRMEGLAAVAMTVGFALLLRQLLECFDSKGGAAAGAVLAYAFFCTGWSVSGIAAAGVSVLLWSVLPACTGKIERKDKLEAQKPHNETA